MPGAAIRNVKVCRCWVVRGQCVHYNNPYTYVELRASVSSNRLQTKFK